MSLDLDAVNDPNESSDSEKSAELLSRSVK
jgi:hypothetical protein